jgi:outer membrane lipopolysaccharide assembly protein LptE/RlpB
MLTFGAVLALALGPGCAGYRLGSTLPPDIKSIHIPTFKNNTTEPLIEVETTNKTIAEFQRDGTLRIANLDEADAVLKVTIYKITLTPLRYSQTDRATPNEYRMTLTAAYTFTRKSTNKVIGQSTAITGETTLPYAGNYQAAIRTAIPRAAEDLGRNLVEKVVEIW